MKSECRSTPATISKEHYRPFFPESASCETTWRGLTPKQNKIANLMLLGLTNPEISVQTNMILQVVKNNVCQIYKRLGVHNRSHLLVRAARESQLLHFPQPDTTALIPSADENFGSNPTSSQGGADLDNGRLATRQQQDCSIFATTQGSTWSSWTMTTPKAPQ
jgi:DNA-binding CsgD family transcriptional regulator